MLAVFHLLSAAICLPSSISSPSGECGHMLAVFHLFPVPELGASKKSVFKQS